MSVSDFIKATLVCAAVAYIVYCYPVISQIVLIGGIAVIWGSYFYRTVISRRAS
jgi:hypothetical protein